MPIVISGLSELSEALTHKSARTAKRWLLKCAEPAAKVVVAAGSQNAPEAPAGTKDTRHPAGMLKASLDYQTRFDKPQQGEDTRLVVKIGLKNDGTSMWYGSLQEFGFRDVLFFRKDLQECVSRISHRFPRILQQVAELPDGHNRREAGFVREHAWWIGGSISKSLNDSLDGHLRLSLYRHQ